jgi:hypothetical protein
MNQTISVKLPPEMSAIEAKLAAFQPIADTLALEHVKNAVLLESCALAEKGQLTFSREKLVETIVRSGEPEITLSLQQYTKTVRTQSLLNGLFAGIAAGLLVGAVLGMIAALELLQGIRSITRPVQNDYNNPNIPEEINMPFSRIPEKPYRP